MANPIPQQLNPLPQPPLSQEDMEKRLEYFIKKRNLKHLKDNVLDKLAELEVAMEREGVEFNDLVRGVAPEGVLKRWEDLNKAKIKQQGVLTWELKKAHESGGLGDKFEEEYKSHREIEERTEADIKAKQETMDEYIANPSKETEIEMVKKNVFDNLHPHEWKEKQEAKRHKTLQNTIEQVHQDVLNQAIEQEREKRRKIKEVEAEKIEVNEILARDKRIPNKVHLKPAGNPLLREFDRQIKEAVEGKEEE